jgi:hypothetical protein
MPWRAGRSGVTVWAVSNLRTIAILWWVVG